VTYNSRHCRDGGKLLPHEVLSNSKKRAKSAASHFADGVVDGTELDAAVPSKNGRTLTGHARPRYQQRRFKSLPPIPCTARNFLNRSISLLSHEAPHDPEGIQQVTVVGGVIHRQGDGLRLLLKRSLLLIRNNRSFHPILFASSSESGLMPEFPPVICARPL